MNKMKRKKVIKIVIIAFVGLLLFIAIFCSYFANTMFQRGWAICSDPLSGPATTGKYSRYPKDYEPPKAKKDGGGNLHIDYDVVIYRRGAVESSDRIGLERRSKIIPASELKPALEIYWECEIYKVDVSIEKKELIPCNVDLPFVENRMSENHEFFYPNIECVFISLDDYWYWYVPASTLNEEPQMALIVKREEYTPWYIWPVRVICYPFFLIADLFVTLPTVIAIWTGLTEPF